MDLEKPEKVGGDHHHHEVNNNRGGSNCGGLQEEESSSGSGSGGSSMRRAETVLRLIPVGLCVAALVVMLKNSQYNEYGSISYSDLGAFKYLVHANGICAGYSLLAAVVVTAVPPGRPSSTMSIAWTLFCLDQLLTYLILTAGASSTEVVYLAYNGDVAVTWSDACRTYGGFCHKARVSVVITFLVLGFYVVISVVSSYRLFVMFDAPPATNGNNGGEAVEG